MAYNHGVKISEVPTSLMPPVAVSAGIPFIVGSTPINMTDVTNVNRPMLFHSYDEAVKACGFVPAKLDTVSGLKKFEYSISEFLQSQFALFGVGPVIVVNVLDPSKHKKTAATTSVTLDAKTGSATITETGILPESVVITGTGSAYTKGTDYVLTFDIDGNLVITSQTDVDGNFLMTTGVAMTFDADKIDPSMVTADDVMGGVDVNGNKTGFELIDECFPRFRLVPGILLAPGFSGDPTLAAVMAAKAGNINQHFTAVAYIDVPTNTVKQSSDVANWKNTNNVVDPRQAVCWPMLLLDDTVYHMSTQLTSLTGQVDSDNGDVPYVSPSNKNFQATATVLEDGTEVWIAPDSGAYLNSQGIVTALNMIGGWKAWGNRTAAYPGVTDVKDAFIALRRMFSWIGNTLVQTFWQNIDGPLNRRQIDTIVDSANIWLNGLAARGYILGGRVEFLETENPTTDLMDGIVRFHVYVTPPSPTREIDFILEYDPAYIQTLFG